MALQPTDQTKEAVVQTAVPVKETAASEISETNDTVDLTSGIVDLTDDLVTTDMDLDSSNIVSSSSSMSESGERFLVSYRHAYRQIVFTLFLLLECASLFRTLIDVWGVCTCPVASAAVCEVGKANRPFSAMMSWGKSRH